MSSIRIFILGSLARRGPMHGHQLRLLAEEEHLDLWTDITIGGLYGALKRLDAEGLIEEVRTEQVGLYPQRKVWRITDDGAHTLSALRLSGLREIVLKPDPFDLILTRLGPEHLDDLPAVIDARVTSLKAMLTEYETLMRAISRYLSVAESLAMEHRVVRLRAEVDWHEGLAGRLAEVIVDEKARRGTHDRAE
ncbi:PadR family transcriptional regulator [Spongiactinospora sp. TRM90649]|uniref:PadR family transcriptional regulator n=1 Tax=Spongiactinospora sp. TRM90649 TaxID=3031114 RepID=UPI0023F6EA61|nr:PadR family transcriptional regulator [Spongiactinospora sp. TRM90649]MDF5753041.1 PadR family transcriptional regulator [Spongiactinospora sp. TRM90649]